MAAPSRLGALFSLSCNDSSLLASFILRPFEGRALAAVAPLRVVAPSDASASDPAAADAGAAAGAAAEVATDSLPADVRRCRHWGRWVRVRVPFFFVVVFCVCVCVRAQPIPFSRRGPVVVALPLVRCLS